MNWQVFKEAEQIYHEVLPTVLICTNLPLEDLLAGCGRIDLMPFHGPPVYARVDLVCRMVHPGTFKPACHYICSAFALRQFVQPFLNARLYMDSAFEPATMLQLTFKDYRTSMPVLGPLKHSTQSLLLLPLRLLLHVVVPPRMSEIQHVDPSVFAELLFDHGRLTRGMQAVQRAIKVQERQFRHTERGDQTEIEVWISRGQCKAACFKAKGRVLESFEWATKRHSPRCVWYQIEACIRDTLLDMVIRTEYRSHVAFSTALLPLDRPHVSFHKKVTQTLITDKCGGCRTW